VVWKVRGPAERPEPLGVTRRYAGQSRDLPAPSRSPSPEPVRSLTAVEPVGSAMESMTLDLGDLPELPDWPDEVIDLDDLPDLPDWPPELADR
jgi:hypothetical protein